MESADVGGRSVVNSMSIDFSDTFFLQAYELVTDRRSKSGRKAIITPYIILKTNPSPCRTRANFMHCVRLRLRLKKIFLEELAPQGPHQHKRIGSIESIFQVTSKVAFSSQLKIKRELDTLMYPAARTLFEFGYGLT